jgi:hypothetical protein
VGTISGEVFRQETDSPRGAAIGLPGWTVYIDSNGDGKPEPGEPTAQTNSAGFYQFTGLATGTYTVREVLMPGYLLSSPTASAGSSYTVTVSTSGTTVQDQNFGNALGPNPIVESLSPNVRTIADAQVGTSTFKLVIGYSDVMNPAIAPTIGFSPSVSSTLSFESGSWNITGTDYTAVYNVANSGVKTTSIRVSVSGAQSSDGDLQLSFTQGAVLSIETSGAVPPPPPPPPPLVTVTKITELKNRKHQVTLVQVYFSGAVNATQANAVGTYRLATPGKKGSYTAKNAGLIKLLGALYVPADDLVALIPRKPFALTKPVQLLANGLPPSGLEDSYGRLIDGDDNGRAGGNAIAILSKKGVQIDAVELAHTQSQPARTSNAVDALLARGELAALESELTNRRDVRAHNEVIQVSPRKQHSLVQFKA